MNRESVIVDLQQAMARDNYISKETIVEIAKKFNISETEVYSIASFYHQFSFIKKGENIIAVCMGTACFVRGAKDIMQMLQDELHIKEGESTQDGKFSIEKNTRCLGMCSSAPVVMINDKIYENATASQIKEVINGLR